MNTISSRSILPLGLLRSAALIGAGALTVTGMVSITPAAHADEPEAPVTNWAAAANGGTVEVSGTEVAGKWTGDKLIDGVINPTADKSEQSRWSSNTSDNAWARVSFTQPHKLHHINLWMEAACPKKWDLSVSEDGKEFVKIASSDAQQCPEGTDPLKEVITIPEAQKNTSVRAIKLQVRERTPFNGVKYGASLWELEAFDGVQPVEPSVPQTGKAGSSLVPKPVSLTVSEGDTGFTITPNVQIVASSDLENEANLLATTLRNSTGYKVPVVSKSEATSGLIRLAKGTVEGSDDDEAYSLVSTKSGITITGVGAHGVFNGSMTLLQLLPGFVHMNTPVVKDWVVPAVTVRDWPRYAYRGMMLDIARSFVPKDDIKKLINTLSQYKVSALHLHLSDDQGWRIEITNDGKVDGDPIDYTQLTEVSGKTAMLPHNQQASQELGRTGFLTQADYREIQEYATQRHVMIIPEIDLPGHTNAALHAIPQLNIPGSSHEGTEQEPTAPANGTGAVGYSYLHPQADITMTFISHVLGQISDMTTGPYIHIGGDEPHALTAKYNNEVYNHFLGQVMNIVRGLGKTPIGWNEIAQADSITAGDVMHYWTGRSDATRAAVQNHGAKVLLSKESSSYLDQKYTSKTPLALNWACRGNCDFRTYYNWDPRRFINLESDESITGTETPLWSETVRGIDQAEFLIFNRVLSHAEIGWTPQNMRDVKDFADRISQIGVDLNATGSNFYDGTDGEWGYDVAGVRSSAVSTEDEFQLGYLSAPGTKVDADGLRVQTDTVNDDDGVSHSLVGDSGLQVMVDWGDGTVVQPATITSTLERSKYNASGMYVLTAHHRFATAGEHTVTLTAGDQSAKAIVNIDANSSATAPLYTPWASTGQASVSLGQSVAKPLDRVELNVKDFAPNSLVELFLGETKIGEVRPDADGTRTDYVLIPAGTEPGAYPVRAVYGNREAETTIAIWAPPIQGGYVKSEVTGLTVHSFDSQEVTGEQAPNGFAKAAIDGNADTFWHTKWSAGSDHFPHFIALNLNKKCEVSGLEYTPRQDSENTRLKDYEIYVSNDGGAWGKPVATGSFDASTSPKYVAFDAVSANYVKLVGRNAQNGREFGGAGEIRIDGDCGDMKDFVATVGEDDNIVTLTEPEAEKATVVAETGSEVKINITGIARDGQATLWVGDAHELVAQNDVVAGKDAILTFVAKSDWDKKEFELITPKNRRYFVLHVTNPQDPSEPGGEPTPENPDENSDSPHSDTISAKPPYVDSAAIEKVLKTGELTLSGEYTVRRGETASIKFVGLAPQKDAQVYLYSTPTMLPGLKADVDGKANNYLVRTDQKTELGAHYVVAVSTVEGKQPLSVVKLNVVGTLQPEVTQGAVELSHTGSNILGLLVCAMALFGAGVAVLQLRRN
ncbi:family 20 glycosylhydrolase [Arcanobacterium phocae]|uniref:family 20 glycosylhydrolase n=1 Tax=Arcanobacterium phocae TaxID=131112 RepID=UPI001C0F3A79|nr:family 20 glycosylhydrolase [Arcanobacterium phocae]